MNQWFKEVTELSARSIIGGSFWELRMKRILEIRSAEGGEDSKLFVKDLGVAYIKHFTRVG